MKKIATKIVGAIVLCCITTSANTVADVADKLNKITENLEINVNKFKIM